MLNNIEWKPLIYKGIDFSDRYMISNDGELYSIKAQKNIKKSLTNGYYTYVASLGKRGTHKLIKIHVAVAETFVDGKCDGLVINHIDGNKLNNNYKNLEWVTQSENIKHAYENGLIKHKTGKRIMCLNTGMIFESIGEASRWCGLKKSSIQNVLKKKCKYAGRDPISGEYLEWILV